MFRERVFVFEYWRSIKPSFVFFHAIWIEQLVRFNMLFFLSCMWWFLEEQIRLSVTHIRYIHIYVNSNYMWLWNLIYIQCKSKKSNIYTNSMICVTNLFGVNMNEIHQTNMCMLNIMYSDKYVDLSALGLYWIGSALPSFVFEKVNLLTCY